MSLNTFSPEIWHGGILSMLQKSLVYGALTNGDYEGDLLQYGDRVRINSISDPTVTNYTKDTDINTPEALVGADQVLVIDQAKYVNFAVDDIDALQNRPKALQEAITRAGYKLRDTIDQYIAGLFPQIAALNFQGTDGAPLTPNTTAGTTPYDYLVNLRVLLDKSNVPADGRFAVLTPDLYGLLLKDNRFVGFGTADNMDLIRNGRVGRAAGMEIYESNNVQKTAANFKIIAGHPMAWSFVGQITKMEAFRPERRFSDAIKFLYVYGSKVVRPDALAVMTSTL